MYNIYYNYDFLVILLGWNVKFLKNNRNKFISKFISLYNKFI